MPSYRSTHLTISTESQIPLIFVSLSGLKVTKMKATDIAVICSCQKLLLLALPIAQLAKEPIGLKCIKLFLSESLTKTR